MIRRTFRKLFPLWGAEDESDDQEEKTEETSEETSETREVSASELEKMTARAADKATRKSRKDFAAQHGFESFSQLEEFIKSQKQAQQESLDETEKALQEADRTKKEFEARQSDLRDRELELAISTAIVGAGIAAPERIKRITALVQMDLEPEVKDDQDSWPDAITSALQEVKDDMPELFSAKVGSAGSGDGGARGKSEQDRDEKAEKEKQLEENYARRGMVLYPH